jgi:hypothetical protein
VIYISSKHRDTGRSDRASSGNSILIEFTQYSVQVWALVSPPDTSISKGVNSQNLCERGLNMVVNIGPGVSMGVSMGV